MIEQYKQLINYYLKAKDRHQPHLMDLAFSEDATLAMKVNTDAIDFPSEVAGRNNITDTLVRNFHEKFDNVYTLCVNDSAVELTNELRCQWLVGMTDVTSGLAKVGHGDYHWQFKHDNDSNTLKVQKLTIIIDDMAELPATTTTPVLSWLDSLPYPWASFTELALSPPNIPIIHEFLAKKKVNPIAP